MIITIVNKRIVGTLTLNPKLHEDEYLIDGAAQVADDSLVEDIDLYEYDNGVLSLIIGWEDIKADRKLQADIEELNGIKWDKSRSAGELYKAANDADIVYMAHTFQADSISRSLLADILSAGSLESNFYWLDASNVKVPMIYSELQELSKSLVDRGQIAFDLYQTQKVDIRSVEIGVTYPTLSDAQAALDLII